MAEKKSQAQTPDAQSSDAPSATGPDTLTQERLQLQQEREALAREREALARERETLAQQRASQAPAANSGEPEKLDETRPGGYYIVDVTPHNPKGRVVNAHGKPIEGEGK